MPDSGSQAMVGTSLYYPHNHYHQHVHVHQHVDQGGIEQTLLVESYPTQPFIEEGKYYIVDVVFVKPYQQVNVTQNKVFYFSTQFLFLHAFGEGNNSIASPNLTDCGPPGSQRLRFNIGPEGNAFSSPVVAPYWTMFPPPPSPLFGNTTTRYAQQPFNTFIASPYVRQANTSVNYLSSGAGPSTSGAVPSKVESVEIVTLSELDLDEPSPRVELSSTESTPGTPHQSTVPDNIGGSNLFTL